MKHQAIICVTSSEGLVSMHTPGEGVIYIYSLGRGVIVTCCC